MMSTTIREGDLLWQPTLARQHASALWRYLRWLDAHGGPHFDDYASLWRWSVEDLEAFWVSIWQHFAIDAHAPYDKVLVERAMPGATWFPGATLNYAEHALRRRDEHEAVVFRSEDGRQSTWTYAELYRTTACAASGLRRLGVGKGDRVVAFAPNSPETLVAFLATVSLGAIWSSTAPEFGQGSVLDRFGQIEPKVLFATSGYRYGGRFFDRRPELGAIVAGLPTLRHVVMLPSCPEAAPLAGALTWDDLLGDADEVVFEPVPFDHPLWVLYSSGTTGLPKPIVHGHGGILLEHYKALALHCDLGPDDRFFWFTTTGWMMWNFLVGGLLVGSTLILYDGSPAYPDLDVLWAMAAETRATYFGTSAPYLMSCRKAGLSPRTQYDLSGLRAVGSTGAPLPAEGFAWVYEHVGNDLLLGSVSGGTDVCTAFVLSSPLLPVYAGEIQCLGLGAKIAAYDAAGRAVTGEVGELVVTAPMPSMPIYFWNDADGERYRDAYFGVFPGVWRHGDWIKVTARESCVIYGRSDATLNRGGVRIGTSELYRVVESLPEVKDSLVVDTGTLEREGKLWLFVVLHDGRALDEALTTKIRKKLKQELSPRHAPDEIRVIAEVPRTLNGKKLEVPVKRILAGMPAAQAANPDTLASPRALEPFVTLAATDATRSR
ncbi:MAG: acetoacetate--CoA ligase [Myxococcota bacterium]